MNDACASSQQNPEWRISHDVKEQIGTCVDIFMTPLRDVLMMRGSSCGKQSPTFPLRAMRFVVCLILIMASETLGWAWKALDTIGPRVSGHAASRADGDRVLLFGGLTGPAGSPVSDELWSYEGGTWNPLEFETGPGRRMYSASAVLDGSLYLFGGWDPGEPGSGGTFLDDVWRLDLETNKWTELEAMPCGPVSRHTACTVGDMIVVHTFRSVLVLKDGKLTEQETTGEAPEGLSMCAVAPLGDNTMWIFGGSTKTQALSSDSYVLNTKTWVWTKLSTADGPSARATPCAATMDDSTCVMFGGASLGEGGYEGGAGLISQDDTWKCTVEGDAAKWEKVLSEGPEARIAATLTLIGDKNFLLQGGYDPTNKETYEAPWVLTRD